MSPLEDGAPGGAPAPGLAESLLAAVPDVAAGEEHRRRRELVRQRLLGDGPPAVRIGRFTLLGLAGSGATSVVYAAYDEELDRKVAVKVLRAPLGPGDERLRREAQALARLAHPNVVAVHEIGHWDGRLFIAMELVRGQPLDAWLGAAPRTWKEIVEVFLQAGHGLAAAHALGLVHRDFKPANVVVGEDGRARVLDFGLVRRAEPQEAPAPSDPAGRAPDERGGAPPPPPEVLPAGSGSLTATGACVGTPAYMAPEQRAGAAADARSDQFSFCVALHEALFGARPGADPARQALRSRRDPAVPAGLARAIDRGLAADPRARWASMDHLLGELARLRWPARRWRLRAAAIGMAALVAAVIVAARHRVAEEQRAGAALLEQAEHRHALERDARLVVAAEKLVGRDPTAAAAMLREVRFPDEASGWRSMTTAVLFEPLSNTVARGLPADCNGLAFSPDGGRLLASLVGGDVLVRRMDGSGEPLLLAADGLSNSVLSADRAWALAWTGTTTAVLSRTDGSVRRMIADPAGSVMDAVFAGTGADVVTVSGSGVVRLWGPDGPRVLGGPPRELAIRDPAGWEFLLGRAGRHVIGTAPSGDAWLWPVRGGRAPVQVATRSRPALWKWFDPDERWLVVPLEGGDLALWNLEAGGSPTLLSGHAKTVTTFDFSRDGRLLATASYDKTVRVWRTDGSGAPVVLRGHEMAVIAVRFDPEGTRVVTGSYDRTVRVWSIDGSGEDMVLRGHAHQISAVAFGPDGRQVATCGMDSVLRLWDVSRSMVRVLGRHDGEIWSASLDPGGRRLVTAASDGTARIWQLDSARSPIVLRGHEGKELYRAVFSPDGRRVATGADDGTARIWSADGSGEPIVIGGHRGWVYGLAFSPDGRWLATGSKDGEIRLSPVDGAGRARILQAGTGTRFGGRVEVLIFGPRGDRILADAHGGEMTASLQWVAGERRRVIPESTPADHPVLAMSPDGRIAIGGRSGRSGLRVWSEDGAELLATLPGHHAPIHELAFSRDGRRLLSAAFDHSARLWDLDRPRDPVILRGHEDWVNTAAFDASERRVVTASRDHTARVWSLDDPDRSIVLRGHGGELTFAGFTAEGKVVTASLDGSVRLWSLDEIAEDAPSLMAQLRRATSACLSADQRMQHLVEPAVLADERFAACEREAGRAP